MATAKTKTNAPTTTATGWLAWLLAAVAWMILAAAILLVAGSGVIRVFDFSHPGDYGEGTILPMVERMQAESVSAAWLDGLPYTISFYGPGYYWAVQATTAMTPWRHTLLPGRLVSLFATLATAVLIGLIVTRRTGRSDFGMAAALVFLVSPIVFAWGTPHRVDPLATLLALAAYASIGNRRRGVVLSAVFVAAGSLVKQTVALAAVPIFVYLLLSGRRKDAAFYAVLVAVLGAAAWLAIDALSGGYYLATAIRGNLGNIWPTQGFWAVYAFLATPLGLVAVIAVAMEMIVPSENASTEAPLIESVYPIGFVAATLFAAVFSCKEGASAAYFLEASALAAVVVGLHGLPRLARGCSKRVSIGLIVLAMLLVAPAVRVVRQRGVRLDYEPYGRAVLTEHLPDPPDTMILADGQHMPAVLSVGGTPVLNDPFAYRVLVDQGTLSATDLVDAMQRGDVGWLVLKRPIDQHREQVGRVSQKWPAEIVDAMDRWYELTIADGKVFLYARTADPGE